MHKPIKIVADENIARLDTYFSSLGKITKFPGRAIGPEEVRDADVILVRSITQVNEALLSKSKVRFVGTCTIGTDHVDEDYLRKRDISFASAPGCNAEAVVDYVLTALMYAEGAGNFQLDKLTFGIVGFGNVGRRLHERLIKLGINCLVCDPYVEIEDRVSYEHILARCDAISFHTPLTYAGAHPTFHLLDEHALDSLRSGAMIINSARGAVIDNAALLARLKTLPELFVVLDVWEGEPDIDLKLLDQIAIATPHIAGYSQEGKIRGTDMIYRKLCNFMGISEQVSYGSVRPEMPIINVDRLANVTRDEVVKYAYDIKADDNAMRIALRNNEQDIGVAFDDLRKNYIERSEFVGTRLKSLPLVAQDPIRLALQAIGFTI